MQTRAQSLVESCVTVATGYAVNVTATLIVMPMFGYLIAVEDALGVGVVMTFISIARTYVVRRLFNHKETRCSSIPCNGGGSPAIGATPASSRSPRRT